MDYLGALAKLGVWLAVYPLGAWTLASIGHETRDLRSHALIVLCVGSAVATLAMVALALAGLFSPLWIGIAGWLLAGVWCWRERPWIGLASRIRMHATPRAKPLGIVAVAAIVMVAGALYAFFPKESLLGERDEGIYAQHALHLLRTGGSAIDLRALGIADDPAILAIERGRAPELPGIYPTRGRWTFQFSAATPVWMAMLGSSLGSQGIFRFNAIVGVLNCLAFFALTRRILKPSRRMWAIAALVVYALQPAQVWISRNSLSEPFCSWFVLNGAVLAMIALTRRSRTLGVTAGALIGMAGFVRIDAVIFPLAIVAAWLAAVAIDRGRQAGRFNPALQEIAFGCAAVTALALGYFLVFVQPYLVGLADMVLGAIIATALCACLARCMQANAGLRIPARFAERGAWPVALAMVALFVYAMWMRPHLQPYALIESKLVPQLNGLRDYREASLVNVAAYLSLPVAIAAGIGAAFAAAWAWRGTPGSVRAWVLVFLLVPTLVYLWKPMVSPDHIWAARRWAPAVFPAFVVFAALGCAALSRRWRTPYAYAAVAVVSLALGANLLWSQRDTLLLREDAGMVAQVAAIAAQLPRDQVSYVVAAGPLASALISGFGARVVPVAPVAGSQWNAVCAAPMHGCRVVSAAGLDFGRADSVEVAKLQIRRLRRVTSMGEPAHGTREEISDWTVVQIGR
ncbi:MAG: hypothetical protein JF591_00350 [Lysobacter sp.]|nr:hypothetical protein [Lysobacter sp.]